MHPLTRPVIAERVAAHSFVPPAVVLRSLDERQPNHRRFSQEDENGQHDQLDGGVGIAVSTLCVPGSRAGGVMSTTEATTKGSAPRFAFGVVLFVAWALATVVWVASTINLAADGEATAVVTAVAALALLTLLCGMEGLEVAVIDRWQALYPDRPLSHLAAWLAARQLFVALIVTTATILINRSELTVPFTSLSIDHGIWLKVFDIVWTGLTVLWLAQIFPKHLAATNPDRYLHYLRRSLFPLVEAVRRIGVSQPGEWVASAVERRLDWYMTDAEKMQESVAPPAESLGHIWRELIPESPPEKRAPAPRDET